jgi:hypothetical protein
MSHAPHRHLCNDPNNIKQNLQILKQIIYRIFSCFRLIPFLRESILIISSHLNLVSPIYPIQSENAVK